MSLPFTDQMAGVSRAEETVLEQRQEQSGERHLCICCNFTWDTHTYRAHESSLRAFKCGKAHPLNREVTGDSVWTGTRSERVGRTEIHSPSTNLYCKQVMSKLVERENLGVNMSNGKLRTPYMSVVFLSVSLSLYVSLFHRTSVFRV